MISLFVITEVNIKQRSSYHDPLFPLMLVINQKCCPTATFTNLKFIVRLASSRYWIAESSALCKLLVKFQLQDHWRKSSATLDLACDAPSHASTYAPVQPAQIQMSRPHILVCCAEPITHIQHFGSPDIRWFARLALINKNMPNFQG